ncbi:EI24 domain-containing protein [Qipengyuania qiaonensis]|uniref:EI24 domain-containing protein n=1 Tax=Qipengyuania qiaonensis TaxID=2867240 RepID=A0ABS7J953_9SPHN|nr:EI24 domain-containing protein [Qipengyuania qiaonensis]MBX7482188.1 EI24 domain-containing protein [Qipengyuania qiaonensis]
MISLPAAFALSLRQLGDPAIIAVLLKTALTTLAIFVVLGGVLLAGLYNYLISAGVAFSAEISGFVAALVTVFAGWFLFRVVALFVLQFFAEDVVRAVETKHYPHAAHTVRDIPLAEEVGNALRSLLRTVLANAAALPIAGLLLVTGIGAAAVFWAVNAFLVGRELRDMVWLRHRSDRAEIAPMGGLNRVLLGGAVVALLAIPFVNLIAPIIGAAAATHMVHRAREKVPHA